MRRLLGTVCLGLAIGLLLSASRAMAGTDVLTWVGPSAASLGAYRSWPFLFLALVVVRRDEAVGWTLWLATAVGYLGHGLLRGPSAGFPWLAAVAAILGALAFARLRSRPSGDLQAPPVPEDGAHSYNALEWIGAVVAGGGTAVALEAIARHVRAFGTGTAQDDTIFGGTFLLLAAFGAAAFGWIFTTRPLRRLSFPVLLAATATACFASLHFVDSVATSFPLNEYMSRWNLRGPDFGGIAWDGVIAARVLVLPAFLLGAALASARGRGATAAAAFGAAVGLWIVPRVFDVGAERGLDDAELFASQLVPLASLVAITGAGLTALSESRRRPMARYVALAAILACAVVPTTHTTKPIVILSPWEGRPIMPYLTYESPVGLITVEPSRFATKVALVDRRRVTPDRDELEADVQRLRDSIALVPATTREKRALRVLFVGQLTPVRSEVLKSEGVVTIDRTAAWWRTMTRVENELFRAPEGQSSMPLPTGTVLSPSDARERIERGDYDLVIAPPVQGDAPAVGSSYAPSGTTVVRWIDTSVPLRGVRNPRADSDGEARAPAVISAYGLSIPTIGFVDHGELGANGPRVVRFVEDSSVASPCEWVRTPWARRTDEARARTIEALARHASDAAASGDAKAASALWKALAMHYREQTMSSPFESPAQGVELSAASLDALSAATNATTLDPFLRRAWDWIARVLVEKRDVASIERVLAPLAKAHGPWSSMEVALAHAELEGLDPQAAAERLKPIVQRERDNLGAWFTLGQALELLGDARAAAGAFRGASELAPDNRMLRRRLALALSRAGDPEGPRLAGELLSGDPKDEEMKACFDGQPPPAPTTYQPEHAH